MAKNFPGPYEVRIFYTSDNITPGGQIQHVQKLNVDLVSAPNPGDSFISMNFKTRGGSLTPAADVAVEAYLALLDDYLNTGVTIGPVELWKYTAGTFQGTFISAYSPVINAGASTNATVPGSQVIATYRTLEGGVMKHSVMEGRLDKKISDGFPTGTAFVDAMHNFIISTANWMLARDTSYPIAGIANHQGINEALFKRRYRP